MDVFVKLDRSGSVYQQVYRALRSAILSGRLAARERLPSTRALAADLSVARNTVLQAFEQLLAEGYVESRSGSGTYVAAQLPDEPLAPGRAPAPARAGHGPAAPRISAYAKRARQPGSPALLPARAGVRVDFRYGLPHPSDFPFDLWRRLVARGLSQENIRTLMYGEPAGYAPLREAIARHLRQFRAVSCTPDQVVMVNGSQQAVDIIARTLLEPGDKVLVEDPGYPDARDAFVAMGARVVPIRVDAEGMDIARAGRRGAGARLAYVTPSHQFPTGAVMPLSRRLALLEWARRSGAYIVEDDYDSEFRFDGRPIEAVQSLDRQDRVIYVGTFSKSLFPSLRLGYAVLPPSLVDPFLRVKYLADRHTSTLVQLVLSQFIAQGHFERHLRQMRKRNEKRRAALLCALERELGATARVDGANAGLHVVVWLPHLRPADEPRIVERAARAGVGVYPLSHYYAATPAHAGLLLGYGSLDEPQIEAGVSALGAVLRAA